MKKILVLLFALLIVVQLSAQNALDSFVNCNLLRNANISLMVRDLASGKTLYEYRANHPTITASTMKTITTSTALELLGGDYRFKTMIEYDGKIDKKGTLHGNIYVRGCGDPTLGSSKLGDTLFLKRWGTEIKKFGIKKIKGNIVADNSAYDDMGINQHWQWEDLGNYYGAGAYALAYKDNTYSIQFSSKEVGTTPEITKVTPNVKELTFINNLKTTNTQSDNIYIFGAPKDNTRTLRGEIPPNKMNITVDGDIPNPGKLLVDDFKYELIQQGIAIRGDTYEISSPSANTREPIFTHLSPELREIIKAINVPSNNHYAEQLFRHLSFIKDSLGTSAASANIIKSYWEQKSLPVDQLFMLDGSGLSPVNAVSALFFVDLLTYMEQSKNSTDFINSLPIAGISGTVKILLDKTRLEGKVRAKSGTITRVRCYVGYLNDGDKKWAFAILVNNQNGSARDVTDKIEEFLLNITQ